MTTYYRIQPAGLGLDHTSEASNGTAAGLDVFARPLDTLHTDAPTHYYGDEVAVIEAEFHWANEDVEGVRIDPAKSSIVRRYSWHAWLHVLAEALDYESDDRMTDRDWLDELRTVPRSELETV